MLFTTDLNGSQEVPAINTDARGIATLLLSEDRTAMHLHAVFSGLSGPITGCHIHDAAAGANGPVLIDVTSKVEGNSLTAHLAVTPGFLAKALKNGLYLNVHTAANPSGEIRGQLEIRTELQYAALLLGSKEVPPVATNASGVGSVVVTPGYSILRYVFAINGLSGPITGAHIHDGAAGVSGPVIVALTTGLPNILVGELQLTNLPPDFLPKLESGQLYVNVHTAANPNGEVRGQLTYNGPIAFETFLNGDQRVPPLATSGNGVGLAFLSPNLDSISYMVAINGMTATGVSFNSGAAGTNGPALLNLTAAAQPNLYVGKSLIGANTLSDMLKGKFYLNATSAAQPNGEIRGQFTSILRRVYAFDLCAEQEVPPTNSTAKGAAYIAANYLNTHLEYRFIASGLSGPATGAHIHDGAFGASGPVYLPLFNPNPVGSGQFQITGNDILKLESGNTYLNIHTSAHPNGEIRGQVLRKLSCSENTTTLEPLLDNITIVPNPTFNQAVLTFETLKACQARVLLADLTGRILYQMSDNYAQGHHTINLDLRQTPPGMYFIQVLPENRAGGLVYKLVKGE